MVATATVYISTMKGQILPNNRIFQNDLLVFLCLQSTRYSLPKTIEFMNIETSRALGVLKTIDRIVGSKIERQNTNVYDIDSGRLSYTEDLILLLEFSNSIIPYKFYHMLLAYNSIFCQLLQVGITKNINQYYASIFNNLYKKT